MKIILSPVRIDEPLSITKMGNILTVNGEDFDFTPMPDGGTLPYGSISSDWFTDDVNMIDNELVVVIRLALPWNYSQEQAFPQPLLDVPDGPVVLPQPLGEEETAQLLATNAAKVSEESV